jgi:hypothetical protein
MEGIVDMDSHEKKTNLVTREGDSGPANNALKLDIEQVSVTAVKQRDRLTTEELLRLGAFNPDQKSRDGFFVPEYLRSQY